MPASPVWPSSASRSAGSSAMRTSTSSCQFRTRRWTACGPSCPGTLRVAWATSFFPLLASPPGVCFAKLFCSCILRNVACRCVWGDAVIVCVLFKFNFNLQSLPQQTTACTAHGKKIRDRSVLRPLPSLNLQKMEFICAALVFSFYTGLSVFFLLLPVQCICRTRSRSAPE